MRFPEKWGTLGRGLGVGGGSSKQNSKIVVGSFRLDTVPEAEGSYRCLLWDLEVTWLIVTESPQPVINATRQNQI